MRTRPLGRTGRTVGELGLGGRALARPGDPRERLRLLCDALEAGVDLVDVAPGWGDAEALAGEAIRATRGRDRVVLATRVPAPPARPDAPVGGGLDDQLPAAWVQRSVEASLRATRLDVLPLVQLAGAAGWRDGWIGAPAWPALRGAMERLVREGKVLWWGLVLPDDADQGDVAFGAALGEEIVATVQAAYNVFRRAAAPRLGLAGERGVGVLVRSPLAGGALTGAHRPGDPVDAALAARVARLAALVGRAPPLAVATDEARAITQEIAWERRYTGDGSVSRVEVDDLVELALRFVLDRPIAAALPSTIDPAHLARNLAVADGRRLSAELAAAVKQHAWPDAPPR